MKKYLLLTLTSVILLGSCQKDDLSWMQEIESIKVELANQKKLIEALQANANITGIETNGDSYTIKFSNGQSITLMNGKTPLVTIGDNGNWFINGEDTGCPSRGEDGIDGSDGDDGVTPAIEIVDGHWWINGIDTGIKAEGRDGTPSPYITAIFHDGSNIIFQFSDGTTISCEFSLNKGILWGKTCFYTGDSIAHGTSAGDNKYGWSGRIAERNNQTWFSDAVSGGTITDEIYNSSGKKTHCISNCIVAFQKQTTKPDYIILEGGTNDADRIGSIINGEIPQRYGSWKKTDYSGNYDQTTFCGAVEHMFYTCITNYPDAKIGFIIAQKMGARSSNTSPMDYSVTGNNRRAYFQTIIDLCIKWGIPYLNLWDNCPLNPMIDSYWNPSLDSKGNTDGGYFYIDGQHLTDKGYNYITNIIESWMATL